MVKAFFFRRHNLRKDVRESLYSEAHFWMKAIGKKRQFLGGNVPNLADLVSVLWSIWFVFACVSVFIYLWMYSCLYSLHDIFLNCLRAETSSVFPKMFLWNTVNV